MTKTLVAVMSGGLCALVEGFVSRYGTGEKFDMSGVEETKPLDTNKLHVNQI